MEGCRRGGSLASSAAHRHSCRDQHHTEERHTRLAIPRQSRSLPRISPTVSIGQRHEQSWMLDQGTSRRRVQWAALFAVPTADLYRDHPRSRSVCAIGA